MSIATAPSEATRTSPSPRTQFMGVDSPELLMHPRSRGCCGAGSTATAAAACAAERDGPSGGTEGESAECAEPPQRMAWSRRDWKSTAAFTIGRPPRAPRVG